jgi:transcriptional regulator with GAF, ATPase, and Fis domain
MGIRKSFRERLRDAERKLVIRALKKADGSITRAARDMGLARAQLRRMVDRHGLEGHLKRAKRPPVFEGNAAWLALADA